MNEINFFNFLLAGSVLIRRIIWIVSACFIVEILWKSFHHKAADTQVIPLLMLPCGWEWFWREYAYYLGIEIPNPYAYWWERSLAPALILFFLLFAGIINKIILAGGIFKVMYNLVVQFFAFVSFLKEILIKTNTFLLQKNIERKLTVFFFFFYIIATLIPTSIGLLLLISILLLLLYTLRFAHDALFSVRKLLLFWGLSSILLIPLSLFISKQLISTEQNPVFIFIITYALFLFIFISWWIYTACMAEDDIAKLALSFINAITTILTIIANIIFVYVQLYMQQLTPNEELANIAYGALVVGFNMIVLPVLAASLLASFVKDLQIYCEKKEAQVEDQANAYLEQVHSSTVKDVHPGSFCDDIIINGHRFTDDDHLNKQEPVDSDIED